MEESDHKAGVSGELSDFGDATKFKNFTAHCDADALNVPYTVIECVVATAAVIGNSLVILVFCLDRKLRRRTNYYIVSLALADFLVGLLGIPFAIVVSSP